jgi:hypothetical protein
MRSGLGVLAGLVLIRLLNGILEQTLVMATAPQPPATIEAYVALRNRPAVLGTTLAAHTAICVIAGYVTGKIARLHEPQHAGILAVLQMMLFVGAFTATDRTALPPDWMQWSLLGVTVPAIVAGAWVRARARELGASAGVLTRPEEHA